MNVLLEVHVQIDADDQDAFDQRLAAVNDGIAEVLVQNGMANESGLDDDVIVAMILVKPTPTVEGDDSAWLERVAEGAVSIVFPVGEGAADQFAKTVGATDIEETSDA